MPAGSPAKKRPTQPLRMTADSSGPSADGEALNFMLRIGGSDPERVIFFLSGHLLGPKCSGFEHFTLGCIEAGTRRLRLDLADLQSLDLDGVNSLLAVHECLSAHGGRLFLTNVNAEVMSVLRLFARPLLATETSAVFRVESGGTGPRMKSRRRLAG